MVRALIHTVLIGVISLGIGLLHASGFNDDADECINPEALPGPSAWHLFWYQPSKKEDFFEMSPPHRGFPKELIDANLPKSRKNSSPSPRYEWFPGELKEVRFFCIQQEREFSQSTSVEEHVVEPPKPKDSEKLEKKSV